MASGITPQLEYAAQSEVSIFDIMIIFFVLFVLSVLPSSFFSLFLLLFSPAHKKPFQNFQSLSAIVTLSNHVQFRALADI